jgi:hypothetical protein
VNQFLRDGKIDFDAFFKELARLNPAVARRVTLRKSAGRVEDRVKLPAMAGSRGRR